MGAILSLFGITKRTNNEKIKELEEQIAATDDPQKKEELKKELENIIQTSKDLDVLEESLGLKSTNNAKTQINEIKTTISSKNKDLEELKKQKEELKQKQATLDKDIADKNSSKQVVQDEIAKLTNELNELKSQMNETRKAIDSEKNQEKKESLMTSFRELEVKKKSLDKSILQKQNELEEIVMKINQVVGEKSKLIEEEGKIASTEKMTLEEINKLIQSQEMVTQEFLQINTENTKRLQELENENRLREEEVLKICNSALEQLKKIEAEISTAESTSALDMLTKKISLVTGCSSDEYNKSLYQINESIALKKENICETEIAELESLIAKIPKTLTTTELDSIEIAAKKLQNCNMGIKTNLMSRLTEAIATKKASIIAREQDEKAVESYYSELSKNNLTVAQLNEIFLKSMEITRTDSEKVKKMKENIADQYNKLIVQEINKVIDLCKKIDISPSNDSKLSITQNVQANSVKLNNALITAENHIKKIEEIYASLPAGHKITLDSASALKPINEFIQNVNSMIAGLSDDVTIYKAKLLFGLITCGYGITGIDESKSSNNAINVSLRSNLTIEGYKANLMFAELQTLLYPLEDPKGPVHNETTKMTDAYIYGYIGVSKEGMRLTETANGIKFEKFNQSKNSYSLGEYILDTDKKTVIGINNSEEVLVLKDQVNGTEIFYVTSPCGPIRFVNINNTIHSELYKQQFETLVQNVKKYKYGSKSYFNIDGIWYHDNSTQTLCTEAEQIELSKKPIGSSFYVTEEMDVEIYRTDSQGSIVYEYVLSRKRCEETLLRTKIIRLVNNIQSLLVSNNDYKALKSKVDAFIKSNVTTWDQFFKQGRAILDSTPDYYWKLLERYLEISKNYPKNNWYNLPSTFRIYDFRTELEAAISLLMNQVFVAVKGAKANVNTKNKTECFKYLNPKTQFDKRCFILSDEDLKTFAFRDSSIPMTKGFGDSNSFATVQKNKTPLYNKSNLSTYQNEKPFAIHYFIDVVGEKDVFPEIAHLTPSYFGYEFVSKFADMIESNQAKIQLLINLSQAQKLFTNMYGLMSNQDIASQIYYDTIIAALQFDLFFCFNNRLTTMSICQNDLERGCTESQMIPMIFAKPVSGKDPLFDL